MKRLVAAIGFAGVCVAAFAQQEPGAAGGYDAMRIEHVGRFLGSFSDSMAIREMTDGVRISLLSEDGSQEALPIRAHTMTFSWEEGDSRPSQIVMEGGVEVDHPQGQLTAEKGVWDFGTGELVFTGNPVMNSETAKGVRGSKMVINFNENTMEIMDMSAAQVPLRGAGSGPRDPSLLTEADVTDWTGLVDTLKTQMRAEAPSPGRQVGAQLGEETRNILLGVGTAALVQEKGRLVKAMNSVLEAPGLYDPAAWEGITLNGEATALLEQDTRTGAEQTRLNRLLLQAAYPDYIKAE